MSEHNLIDDSSRLYDQWIAEQRGGRKPRGRLHRWWSAVRRDPRTALTILGIVAAAVLAILVIAVAV